MQTRRRRRVLYLIDSRYFGGAEQYIALLASSLDRELFEPAVCFRVGGALDGFEKRLAASGVRAVRIPEISAGRVLRTLRSERPDIFHLNLPSSYDCGFGYPAVLAVIAGCKGVVATEHLPMIRTRKLGVLKRLFARFVDRFITVSQANVPYLRAHGVPRGKIVVIRNGVQTRDGEAGPDRAEPSPWGGSPDEFRVGFVGSLTGRKGLAVALRAVEILKNETPPVRFLLVGDGELRHSLEETAKSKGLADRVTFLGYRDDARGIMKSFDVLILPSSMEGLPLVILEAMAEGLPVVATKVYGIPEVVVEGETGLLIEPGDAEALAESIRRLAGDPELRSGMGRRGRRRIREEFNCRKMAEETERVYLSLTGRGAGG